MEILTTHLDYKANDAFKDELSVWTKKETMKKIATEFMVIHMLL